MKDLNFKILHIGDPDYPEELMDHVKEKEKYSIVQIDGVYFVPLFQVVYLMLKDFEQPS